MYADLHLHTRYSDGTYSPAELVTAAQRHGLSALAVTDHDTVEVYPEITPLCAAAGLELLTGTELTAEWHGQELHLLGYGINPEHPRLRLELARFQSVRQNRIREIVRRLNELNIPLEAEAVFSLASCNAPGRPHIGRALVQAGFCVNLDEAFDLYLKKHRPAWVPKFKLPAGDCIQLIHEAGGLAVMAHPALNHADHAIPHLVDQGLDGLECFHTKHTPELAEHYLRLAQRHALLVTGGSDCHGLSKGRPTLGGVKLPYPYFVALKQRWAARQSPPPQSVSPPTATTS